MLNRGRTIIHLWVHLFPRPHITPLLQEQCHIYWPLKGGNLSISWRNRKYYIRYQDQGRNRKLSWFDSQKCPGWENQAFSTYDNIIHHQSGERYLKHYNKKDTIACHKDPLPQFLHPAIWQKVSPSWSNWMDQVSREEYVPGYMLCHSPAC